MVTRISKTTSNASTREQECFAGVFKILRSTYSDCFPDSFSAKYPTISKFIECHSSQQSDQIYETFMKYLYNVELSEENQKLTNKINRLASNQQMKAALEDRPFIMACLRTINSN
jgi:hypothetical protein